MAGVAYVCLLLRFMIWLMLNVVLRAVCAVGAGADALTPYHHISPTTTSIDSIGASSPPFLWKLGHEELLPVHLYSLNHAMSAEMT